MDGEEMKLLVFRSEENVNQAWKKIRYHYYFYNHKRGQLTPKEKIRNDNVFQFNEIDTFYNQGKYDKRLEFFSEKFLNDTFEPTPGSKFYVPKQNRGLRPFVVLTAEDLIYYQCFTNYLVELFKDDFELLQDNFVFSNIPEDFKNSRVVKYWLNQLKKFNIVVNKKLETEKVVAHTDITSFYTEISYIRLKQIILGKLKSKGLSEDNFVDSLITALQTWSNGDDEASFKGIPQGLPQSHILANIYLFPLDHKIKGKVDYIRWVDDYRIFCGSAQQLNNAIIILDEELRKYDLLLKESKTFIVDRKLPDPFKSFEDDIRKILNQEDKESFVISDFLSLGEGEYEVENNESDKKEEKSETEDVEAEEVEEEEEAQSMSSSRLFYLLKNVDPDELFKLCKKHILESITHIYIKEDLKDIFGVSSNKAAALQINELINLKSKKTTKTSDILTSRYERKLRFIYKTILPLITQADNLTFYILYQIVLKSSFEVTQYYPFFQFSINKQEVSEDLRKEFIDWLLKQLKPDQTLEFLKYYILEILDSDINKTKRSEIEDMISYYIKSNDTSWFFKYRCYKSFLMKWSQDQRAIQFCLEHFNDPNNSNTCKLSLATDIVEYRKNLDLLQPSQKSRQHELQNLLNLALSSDYSSLNLFGSNLKEEYEFLKAGTNNQLGKIYRQYIGEIEYKCLLRKNLEKLFQINLPEKFSFKDIIDEKNQLQPPYDIINMLCNIALKSMNEQKYDVYVNSVTGVLEAIMFTLYSRIGIVDTNNVIEGFNFHKRVLNNIYYDKRFNWDDLIDEIGNIRNKTLLSHIRDIKTAEFNPIVDLNTIKRFNQLASSLLNDLITCLNFNITDDRVVRYNNKLAEIKKDYKKYYDKVQEIIPILKKALEEKDSIILEKLKELEN